MPIWLDKWSWERTVQMVKFASGPENLGRLLWSTTVAVVVSVAAGVGLVMTSGDTDSVTAATKPSPTTAAATETATYTATTTPTPTGSYAPTPAAATGTDTTAALDGVGVEPGPVVATTTATAATLAAGSPATDIAELQRQLNVVTGSRLELDGIYGVETTAAVRNFQTVIGVEVTGLADPATRWTLAEAAAGATLSNLPTIGAGGANGCQVAVIGDSLMAGTEELYTNALSRVTCAAAVDGEGGRSLAYGWQCRVDRDGRRPLLLFDDRIAGNDTCAPSGLTLLASWAEAAALGDVVVVALGTNDSGLFEKSRWQRNWAEALRLAGGRPVVFLTTQARPGSDQSSRQSSYTNALRQWCTGQEFCVLAEWGNTAAANNPASYADSVHLNVAATRERAAFIADVVAALLTGQPIPNPQPPPTPTVAPADTTTTTVATVAASTTTAPSTPTPPATTAAPPTTSSTTTATSPATTTTTTTVAPMTTTSTTTTSTTTSTTVLGL
jgi:lysophospholipase L1-like esterase